MAYKEEKLTVFADDDWYKKDTDKIQEWTGILQKATPVTLPPHSGTGPVVTTFYQLGVIIAPQIPLQEKTIYSHAQHSKVLDQHLNQQVKIIGKLHEDQIWPGYLIPLTNPGGPIIPPTNPGGPNIPAGGSSSTNPGGPIKPVGSKILVFAHDEWYKKDNDKTEEWTGTLAKYDEFTLPPNSGVGPVVTLFYKLDVVIGPQIPIQTKVIYTHGKQSKILEQHLNQQVRIIGKLNDNQIWPGYLIVLTNPGGPIIPVGGSGTTNPGGPISDPTNIVEPIILVFADDDWYKKNHEKIEQWSGKLQKYDQFKIPPGEGHGPVQTLFYELDVVVAKELPIQQKVVYSDNTHDSVLDAHIGKEVTLIGKLQSDQIWPGYLVPIISATGPGHIG